MKFSDDAVLNLKIEMVLYGITGILLVLAPILLALFTSKELSTLNIVVLSVFAVKGVYGDIVGRAYMILNSEMFIVVDEGEKEVLKDEEKK